MQHKHRASEDVKMGDQEAQGDDYERKAEKKLKGWGLFGSKYDDAAELFEKAANSYKLGKAWDKAAGAYINLANCHLKSESKHEAATAYVDAANCYKKTQPKEAVRTLNIATSYLLELGRFQLAAKHYKDIGELYEKEEDFANAIENFDKAAELYQGEEVSTSSNQCKLKVAQLAAQVEDYPRAIEIFELVGRQSLDNNLLKYSVKGYLLNAGLCHIAVGDGIGIQNALDKYQEWDPSFEPTRECKFLADLAKTLDEEDVDKFTDVVKEFDSMTRLDQWKTTLLLRAKDALKAKEEEEDDLT